MGYDILLFKPSPEDDLQVAAELRFLTEESAEVNPGPIRSDAESHKRLLSDSLIRLNPELQVFAFDYETIARLDGISAEEARRRYRHRELNGNDRGNGVQIILYDDWASISIPFWHTGKQATDSFDEIWKYLDLFKNEAGYIAYDPQLRKILDLRLDLPEVLSIYEKTVRENHPEPTEEPHVYDKAKYHYDGDYPIELPKEQAYTHTGMFLGWVIDHNLYSSALHESAGTRLQAFKSREVSGPQIYVSLGGVFDETMLSREANEFAKAYFNFDTGKYLDDYDEVLGKGLPSLYHVADTWENYSRMRARIDQRYEDWKLDRLSEAP